MSWVKNPTISCLLCRTPICVTKSYTFNWLLLWWCTSSYICCFFLRLFPRTFAPPRQYRSSKTIFGWDTNFPMKWNVSKTKTWHSTFSCIQIYYIKVFIMKYLEQEIACKEMLCRILDWDNLLFSFHCFLLQLSCTKSCGEVWIIFFMKKLIFFW